MAIIKSIRKHKAIALLGAAAALIVLIWVWDGSASIRGKLAARIDLRRGRYEVLGYGLPTPSRPQYASCLHKRYNVGFRAVAGCIVSQPLVSYVDGYDSVVAEVVTRRFGHDVFKECSEEAERNWVAQIKAKKSQSRTLDLVSRQ